MEKPKKNKTHSKYLIKIRVRTINNAFATFTRRGNNLAKFTEWLNQNMPAATSTGAKPQIKAWFKYEVYDHHVNDTFLFSRAKAPQYSSLNL